MTINNKDLTGIWAPALTSLKTDLSIDADKTIAHMKALLVDGCHGTVVFGTTGEANSFSVAERKQLLEQVVEAKIASDQIMIGTGCCALSDTVDLTRHALDLGCTKMLVLPPFYYKNPSDTALVRSYTEVIDRVASDDLELLFYHFPRLSTVPITVAVIEQLLQRYPDTIVGIKDSSGDWKNTKMLLEMFPNLAVFPGTEMLLLDALRLGGAGTITATANIIAAAIRRVFDLWLAQDEKADQAQKTISAFRSALNDHPLISALKLYLSEKQQDKDWLNVRPPLENLSDAQSDKLMQKLDSLGLKV